MAHESGRIGKMLYAKIKCGIYKERRVYMGLFDTLGKIGKTAAKGTLWYLEEASKSSSRSKNYTDEQRESFREYSERMHDYRMRLSECNNDDDYDY